MSMFRRKRKPRRPRRRGRPRAMSMDEFTQRVAADWVADGVHEPDTIGHRLGAAPPSDIGEADVDVACRWREENVPGGRGGCTTSSSFDVDGAPVLPGPLLVRRRGADPPG